MAYVATQEQKCLSESILNYEVLRNKRLNSVPLCYKISALYLKETFSRNQSFNLFSCLMEPVT